MEFSYKKKIIAIIIAIIVSYILLSVIKVDVYPKKDEIIRVRGNDGLCYYAFCVGSYCEYNSNNGYRTISYGDLGKNRCYSLIAADPFTKKYFKIPQKNSVLKEWVLIPLGISQDSNPWKEAY